MAVVAALLARVRHGPHADKDLIEQSSQMSEWAVDHTEGMAEPLKRSLVKRAADRKRPAGDQQRNGAEARNASDPERDSSWAAESHRDSETHSASCLNRRTLLHGSVSPFDHAHSRSLSLAATIS